MAYERGGGSVEVELSKTQSWIENADIDLYGRNGDLGVIREHRDDRATQAAFRSFVRGAVTIIGLLSAVPVLIDVGKIFGWIPK